MFRITKILYIVYKNFQTCCRQRVKINNFKRLEIYPRSTRLLLKSIGIIKYIQLGIGATFLDYLSISPRKSQVARRNHLVRTAEGWCPLIAGRVARARAVTRAREITNDAVYAETASNCVASCVALSPESGARSSRTVPTRLGYLPPGVSTSSAQQREAGAVVEAPSHRQHRARLLSFPSPRSSTLPRASLHDSSRNRSAKSPSMRALINQRAPSIDQWQSTENLLDNQKTNRRITGPRQCCRQQIGSPSAWPNLATGEDATAATTATTTTEPGAGPGNRNGPVLLFFLLLLLLFLLCLLLLFLLLLLLLHVRRAQRRRECDRGWTAQFHVAERRSWTPRRPSCRPSESRSATTWTCRCRRLESPSVGDLLDPSSPPRE